MKNLKMMSWKEVRSELENGKDIKVYKNRYEKRWVYGTRSESWHLVNDTDRDFAHGIAQATFNKIGKAAAKEKYLGNSLIK